MDRKRKGRSSEIIKVLVLAALGAVFILTSCQEAALRPTPSANASKAYTEAAGTFTTELTLEAGQTAVSMLTEMSAPRTPPPATATSPILVSPLPDSPTAVLPTQTSDAPTPVPATAVPTASFLSPTPAPCNLAEYIADVTIPDGATFAPGSPFVKTWRLQNAGSCTWTNGYELVFVDGDAMGPLTGSPFTAPVQPGQVVDASIRLTAPFQDGTYTGRWLLRSLDGFLFGAGPNANDSLTVQIRVIETTGPGALVYDFSTDACAADWASGEGILDCPGSGNDSDGSVIILNNPNLESGQVTEVGLWLRPNESSDGWISGSYPAMVIQNGDIFQTEIGCMNNSPGCELLFELDYRVSTGAIRRLGSWQEAYDGFSTPIDLDLSGLAGRRVELILSVRNFGQSDEANAIWVHPRIISSVPTNLLVLSWRQEGGPADICKRLRIAFTGDGEAQATALTCDQGNFVLGSIFLNDAEYIKMLSWYNRLRTFEGQLYRASPSNPLISDITLKGSGSVDATDTDIRAIDSFASDIYSEITR